MDIKLSIVLPTYNVENYIVTCLKSIFNNPIEELEIIIINDGSTDRTVEICSDFFNLKLDIYNEFMYRGIKVIIETQFNQGVSVARNRGIELASGKYIMFIDPDDYIHPSLLKKIRKVLSEDKDFILFGYYEFREEKNKILEKKILPKLEMDLETQSEVRERLLPSYMGISYNHIANWYKTKVLYPDKEFGAVWRCCYKLDIIERNSLAFNNNICVQEDELFNIWYLCFTNNVKIINEPLYYYTIRDTGLMTKKFSLEEEINNKIILLNEKMKVIHYLKEQDDNYSNKMHCGSTVLSIIELYSTFIRDKMSIKNYYFLKKYINHPVVIECIELIPLKNAPIKQMLIFTLFKLRLNYIVFILQFFKELKIKL